tara:strand:+ start:2760 stop:3260 length:501 start_codon:yes stop_codon:yes gene_type:complete
MAIAQEVQALRQQGLNDPLIMEELTKKGYKADEVNSAISGQVSGIQPAGRIPSAAPQPSDDSVYERIEAITENIIDEKWDELIAEVKKIVEWKQQVQDKQTQMANDLAKIKEDFKTLHSGVLGKLQTYDNTIKEVGTELNAVGKVFKDVIPTFVENVKELKHIVKK